jgi:hypothetical protein
MDKSVNLIKIIQVAVKLDSHRKLHDMEDRFAA